MPRILSETHIKITKYFLNGYQSWTDSHEYKLAKRLRNEKFRGHIIFLTSYKDYVFDGYLVQATDFLMKPIDYERFTHCMNIVQADNTEKTYTIKTKKETITVPLNEIYAFVSEGHYVNIIKDQNENAFLRQRVNFNDFVKSLPSGFIRVHRTVVINISKIIRLTKNEVELSDNSVYPVSANYLNDVRKEFSKLLL